MVGLLKKALGGGKSDFFLELDESQQSETEAKQPESKPVESPPAEKPAAEAQNAQAQPPSQTSNNKPVQKPAPASTPAKASEPQSAAEIIAAAVNGSKTTSNEAAEDKTFAPNYLMPMPTQSRRRPGPSLKMFQDMARQVNGRKG